LREILFERANMTELPPTLMARDPETWLLTELFAA
jgi:hypothetical protein